MKVIPYDKRIKDIEEKTQYYRNIKEFYKYHPYLYKWALKHNVELRKYFPKRQIKCKLDERTNKGIDCYLADTNKFYKHFPFLIDALRELDLTYYYVHKVLNGEIPSIEGYTFVRCD